jgi:hypothetical protein
MGLRALSVLVLASSLAACGANPAPPPRDPGSEGRAAGPSREHDREHPQAPQGAGSSDGTTCEEARDRNVEEVAVGSKGGPADLTAGALGGVLNNGAYLVACDVPGETRIHICAAVKGGAAVGVTVTMTPASPELEVCVAKAVRGLPFPSHPKMDIVKTTF